MVTAPSAVTKSTATILAVTLITLAVLLVYAPTSTFPFINIDDNFYVYKNPQVSQGLTPAGIKWAFLAGAKEDTYWHPLTWLSLMLDVEIFGVNPAAHHTINWLIHLVNAILLFYLLKNITGYLWRSAFIAVIFAVHPVNIESVVWIAERKNVLSTFFCMATFLTYCQYTTRPTTGRYLYCLALFALGLLSKPMLVTLPAVLLLLDFWPLQRWRWPDRQETRRRSRRQSSAGVLAANRRLLLEKVPLLAMSIVLAVYTSLSVGQKTNAAVSFQTVPLSLRLENVCTSFVAYLGKLVYPADPALLYPFPTAIPLWQVIIAALLLGLITSLALINLKQRPWLAMGWLWFLITMLPVTGIIQVGVWPRIADHLIYLPEIGLLLIGTWGLTELADRLGVKHLPRILTAGAVTLLLMGTACRQIWYWQDSVTLYKQSLAVGGPHPMILDNLGEALLEQDRPLAAVTYLKQAQAMDPEHVFTMTYLGVAYARLNQLDEAISQFQHAVKNAPGYKLAQDDLAIVTEQKAHFTATITSTQAALAANPDSPELLNQLGFAFSQLGQTQNAIESYNKSIRLKPDNPRAFNELGALQLLYGKTQESVALFQEALRLDPNFAEAQNNLLRAQSLLANEQE